MASGSWGKTDSKVMACTYRLYDATGRLLYVGVADDFDKRFKDHRANLWWPDVAHREVIWFACRLDALYEESRAIATENPIHNDRPGISPVGLKLFRLRQGGRLVAFNGKIAATRLEKNATMRFVENGSAHGWVTYEGRPAAIAIPVDWYLEACRRMGTAADLTDAPAIDWEKV